MICAASRTSCMLVPLEKHFISQDAHTGISAGPCRTNARIFRKTRINSMFLAQDHARIKRLEGNLFKKNLNIFRFLNTFYQK